MGGGNALRTRETAAAQVGATPEEIDALVVAGRLRVLAAADGGGWLTTARAVSEAVRGRSLRRRPRRARPAPRQVRAPRAVHTAPARRRVEAAPVAVAPAAPPPPSRAVAVDRRTDIAPAQRLDVAAVAAHLGVTAPAALRLMQGGKVRATRLGREWITTTRALADHCGTHGGGRTP